MTLAATLPGPKPGRYWGEDDFDKLRAGLVTLEDADVALDGRLDALEAVASGAATASAGWAINSQTLKRTSSGIVVFALTATRTGAASTVQVATLPVGFRPAHATVPLAAINNSDGAARGAAAQSAGPVWIYGGVADANAYHFAGSWTVP